MTFDLRTRAWFFASIVTPLGLSAPPPQGPAEPLYKITIKRTIPAVNYRPNSSTRIDLRGTALAFQAMGDARVASRRGTIWIDAHFESLAPASDLGPEFLTYVLWAISPEGRARNLGEVVLKDRESRLKVSTSLQSFGMMLTAEPYFAVSIPSEVVVMENVLRRDTQSSTVPIDAKFELLQRGDYSKAGLQQFNIGPKAPLDLYQARNAVQIAKSAGADRYSADSLVKSTNALQKAEIYQSHENRRLVISSAREAVQAAEDARVIAVRRAEEQFALTQKAEAVAREQEANTRADSEAQQKREAERAAVADLAAARAEAARARAELQEERAKQEAEHQRKDREVAEAARLRAEIERQDLRAGLLQQFNAVLETRDTPRGLVVNMGDVLFDTGRFDLKPLAREALAKLSGIVVSHPGLTLEIEGYTDSFGDIEFNKKLSEKRAESVRSYLIEQRLPQETVIARGFGKGRPVASNNTVQGPQLNRRVEIVISGEVIGVDISTSEALKVR